MVRWARFNQDEDLFDNFEVESHKERWNDLGIIIDIDVWDSLELESEPETIIIEVYFFKIGIVWCNPKSLEVVSIIKDTD
mgnify:CR=1 FL=1